MIDKKKIAKKLVKDLMNNRSDEFESLHEYKKKYEELKGALFGQDSDAMNHGQALTLARYLFDKLIRRTASADDSVNTFKRNSERKTNETIQ